LSRGRPEKAPRLVARLGRPDEDAERQCRVGASADRVARETRLLKQFVRACAGVTEAPDSGTACVPIVNVTTLARRDSLTAAAAATSWWF
jgi:hypothetical protein